MLEKFIKSEDRKEKQGLDALIACYITLKKEAGLPLIEELFLKNKKSDYADTYAAIMALRFHASEGKVVEKKRLLEGFHYMLERPELADLVIPDLARFEDWAPIANSGRNTPKSMMTTRPPGASMMLSGFTSR